MGIWPPPVTGIENFDEWMNLFYRRVASKASVPTYSSAAEVITGTEAAKAIAPDQLALTRASAAEIVTGTAVKMVMSDQLAAAGVYKDTNRLQNLSFAASVGSKILTVALKGEDGNNPSATNTVTIAFRDETLTTGTPNIRTVTGALSVALASGGTLGFTAALAGRIYVWAIDNAGTVELALSRTADIFQECNLISTTAIGSGSDLATVMYSTTARTNVACRCIGYIEITTGATAGEWDNAPTKIQIMGPGVKRTGDIVQVASYCTGAVASGATAFVNDDTIPQNTEGNAGFSKAITPTSTINLLLVDVVIHLQTGANNHLLAALFSDYSGADALAVSYSAVGGADSSASRFSLKIHYAETANQVTAKTYSVRFGTITAATATMNGAATARLFGGTLLSGIDIKEVFA